MNKATRSRVVGFVGLGRMGSALACRYLDAGSQVIAYDPAPQRREKLAAAGAHTTPECAELFAKSEIVVACLPSAQVSSAVAEQLIESQGAVRCYVEASTIGQSACRDIAQRLTAAGIDFVDAPVSGGPRGAAAGRATSMVAGSAEAVTVARPTIEGYSDRTIVVGDTPGLAQACKLVNNAISLSTLAIACEATAFGVRAGLDLGKLIEAINVSSGRCAATLDKFPQSIITRTFDYGASIEVAAKDLDLFVREASGLDSELVCTPAIAQLWQRAGAAGDPQRDFTELYRFFEDESSTRHRLSGQKG